MKQLFFNRPFMLLMISDIFQNLGIWIRNMALLFFVIEQTGGDPIAVSILTIVEYFPIFLFSIIGGVMADRWKPKRTMIWGDIFSFLSVLIIILVIETGYWQAVFAATAVSAIVSQFSQPSSMKMIKQHVEESQIQAAMAISQMFMSLFIIIGPIVGTLIYQLFGLEQSLISLLVIFAISTGILSFLPKSVQIKELEKTTPVADLKAGLQYVKKQRNLKVLMVMFAILAFGAGLVQPLEVFIIMERLSLEKENLQWFTALSGVGMLIGGVLAAASSNNPNGKKIIFSGLFFLGITTFVEVLSIWPIITGAMSFTTGIFLAFVQTILAALMLTSVEEAYIGRINGLITPIFTGLLLIGTSLSGIFMEATSLLTVYFTAGFIFILASLVSLQFSFSKKEVATVVELTDES